jgi:hypothetical protein
LRGDISKFKEYIDQIEMVSSRIKSITFEFYDENYQNDKEIQINISGFKMLEKIQIYWGE